MAQIAWFILVVRLLGYMGMCQLVLKDQITWPNPLSLMSRWVTAGVATLRRGVEAVSWWSWRSYLSHSSVLGWCSA